jgi:hypothetical protein
MEAELVQQARAAIGEDADMMECAGACAYAAVPRFIEGGDDYVVYGDVGDSIDADSDSAPVCWHHAVQVRPHHCTWRRTVAVTRGVCSLPQLLKLLQVLHNAGIVHRDIRPDNLLFIRDSIDPAKRLRLMLIDWAYASRRNAEEPYCGATGFVSPAVAQHLIDRQKAGGDRTFRLTAGDDLYSWLLVCVWVHSKASMTAVLWGIEDQCAKDANLQRKQGLIDAMFKAQLRLPMWRRLHDAVVTIMNGQRDRVEESGSDRLPVDYTELFDLIPLGAELTMKDVEASC